MTDRKYGSTDTTLTAFMNLPRAKRSQKLSDLSDQLKGRHLQEEVEVFGHKYGVKTLDPGEISWADQFVQGSNAIQLARSQMIPYVAAALVSIDGEPVEKLFELPSESLSEDDRELSKVEAVRADWLRQEVMAWLLEECQIEVVQQLWVAYTGLVDRKRESLEAMRPLSEARATQPGPSALTSLHAKGSSSVTPPSQQ